MGYSWLFTLKFRMRNKLDKELIEKLSNSQSKTDIIRLENLCPELLSDKQKVVLDKINIERNIYQNAVRNINVSILELTSLLNLGRTSSTAVERIREKVKGLRAYSILDLVVIQLIELMVKEGVEVTSIAHDKRLKTTLGFQGSKSALIKRRREGQLKAGDRSKLEQFDYQVTYYSTRLLALEMTTKDLTYLLNLGVTSLSSYSRIYDKLHGTRPYSVLDLVVARLFEEALDHDIHPNYIKYNAVGEVIIS